MGVEILAADMEAGRGVGSAGTARDHDDTRPSGELAPGLGGHGGAAFLPADGDRDVGVVERVEQRQIAFAGNAEDAFHAVQHQRIGEEARAALGIFLCHGFPVSDSKGHPAVQGANRA